MPTSDAPTSARGYVDDSAAFGNLYGSLLEQVPDLTWPASITTYTGMATDPQLAAVLKSYRLPVVRADWGVDPMGARPEVAQLVADGLGLTVRGDDRAPSGARVRGVRWNEHIRAALHHLVYGHMGFELEATITDRARLSALYERMPSTFTEIKPGRNGALESVTQAEGPTRNPPPIPAEHLQWYVHDRVGAAWQGTSLLRPAYGPWLLKREMWRVLGVSSQRFGTGVMTFVPKAGTTPTPAQIDAAQRMASSVRVGNRAGMVPPPGFEPQLVGLTGSVPDTLGFVRYLDQQMTRMALSGVVDLGDTPNGSRALGDTFVDLLLLALQEVGDGIADAITTQTVARIVDWNWGEDEPVPAVVCGDVGARHEVTAEALAALITAGALSWDPTLEESVRKMWKLPARDPNTPPVPPPGPRVVARARARAR